MNYLKLKRMYLVLALVLVIGVIATGCMNQGGNGMLLDSTGDNTDGTAPQPSPSASYMPQGMTSGQGTSNNGQSAANESGNRFDWMRNASQVEARLNQISEIDDARVVVTGDTALVGVHFDRAYQGEMTERIREMVAAEVMAADPQITTVAVTANSTDVDSIFDLSERSSLGRDLDTLKEDIEEIVRNATTLR